MSCWRRGRAGDGRVRPQGRHHSLGFRNQDRLHRCVVQLAHRPDREVIECSSGCGAALALPAPRWALRSVPSTLSLTPARNARATSSSKPMSVWSPSPHQAIACSVRTGLSSRSRAPAPPHLTRLPNLTSKDAGNPVGKACALLRVASEPTAVASGRWGVSKRAKRPRWKP